MLTEAYRNDFKQAKKNYNKICEQKEEKLESLNSTQDISHFCS